MVRTLCLFLAAALALGGCGETAGERTLTGAGIGAGTGAVIGAVAGTSILPLAIAGAAVGGVAGFVTDKNQIDLGRGPVEKQPNAAQVQPAAGPNSDNSNSNKNAAVESQELRSAAGPQQAPPQQQAYAPADRETIRSIQDGLSKLGFDPGPADGIAGTKTRDAIRAFQQQAGLPADGVPTQELAKRISEQIAARGR